MTENIPFSPTGRALGLKSVDEAALMAKLGKLVLEDKASLLAGADNWSMTALPSIGLRAVVMSDGPNGVRGLAWGDERNASLLLPNVASMAASWDEALLEEVGALLAAEARRKGIDVLLGPGVNLHRTPLGGRNFEYYGEDPWQTARLGAAYVRGLQSAGVAACVKHYVLNETEEARRTYDVRIDERVMREVHLLPFEMTVAAGAASLMSAYNRLGGRAMTANRRLNEDILRDEWGFDGALISDWQATWADRQSPPANGLDLSMPGPDPEYRRLVVDAVESGRIPEAVIDGHVLRLLRFAARVGGFQAASGRGADMPPNVSSWLRALGARGMTLLKNEPVGGAPLLPLSGRPARVAIIGPAATAPCVQGGGSASLTPPYVVTPLAALREALGDDVRIDVAEGGAAHRLLADLDLAAVVDPETGAAGLRVEAVAADGKVLRSEVRRTGRLLWAGASEAALPAATVAVRVRFHLMPAETGTYRLGLAGCGRQSLAIDGAPAIEVDVGPGTPDNFEVLVRPHQLVVPFTARAGVPVEFDLTRPVVRSELAGFVPIGFGLSAPSAPGIDAAIAEAAAVASAADIVLLFIGNTGEDEAEGYDRPRLGLPGRQDQLAAAVLAANPRTVVVVNASSAVLMPWIDGAPAVLWSGLGGQEYGHAVADVLLGHAEPSGRLTASFPARAEDAPVLATSPVNGVHVYAEGLRFGYRGYAAAGTEPLFPFGHGLGYGRWSYDRAEIEVRTGADPADLASVAAIVTVTLANAADRPSREVVQIYAEPEAGDADAAPLALVGFTVVEAGGGETITVAVPIAARALARYGADGWELPAGSRRLHVSRSCRDHRLTLDLSTATR